MNRGTKITSFKTTCYCNHLAQILTFDFCLAFINVDLGNLIETE